MRTARGLSVVCAREARGERVAVLRKEMIRLGEMLQVQAHRVRVSYNHRHGDELNCLSLVVML